MTIVELKVLSSKALRDNEPLGSHPYGFLASISSKSKAKWTVFLSGSLLSVAIELTQLFTHRGLFEFDDMLHNTLGTVIGIALCLIAAKFLVRIERKYNIQLT